jgi:hypothetical protein
LDELATAERHIAQGHRHIGDQLDRIAKQEHAGRDATVSRQLLDTFLLSQQVFESHHAHLTQELAEATGSA